MLTKLVQRKLFRLSAVQCSGGMRRSAEGEALSQPTRFTKFKAYLKKEANLLSTTMVTQSTVTANLPIISWKASKTLSLSDVAGHGSFILLACSYLVTDFFQLRMFAASGVTLSIIFQYYRERPLWIPIRWNSLFLLINAVMIVLLLKEENDAHNIPAEKKAMYDGFARKGMNPVDFMLLISAAKRIDVKKGDVVVAEHLKNTRVFLVKRGTLSVIKNGSKIRTVMPSQFTGEMSFLRWEDRMDTTAYVKKHSKTLKKWANKDDEMELFLPLLIICERLAKRWGLSSAPVDAAVADAGAPSEVVQQLSAPDEHSTEDATYGFNVDSFGNVISEEQGSSADDPSVEPEVPEQTVFGRYLSASYNFIGGLFSSEQAAAEEAPQVEANSEGELAAATVVAEEDCVLYYWSFKRLRVLLDQHPSLGRAFERVLSDDLNRKMVNTMHVEPLQRYQLLLAAATMDGEVSQCAFCNLLSY